MPLTLTTLTKYPFFFLYCYRDHRALHSFPTRRSSDLVNIAAGTYFESDIKVNKALTIDGQGATRDDVIVNPSAVDGHRSEEHMSELQSRFDLVCRLLLEKKNSLCEWRIAVLSWTTVRY